MAMSSKYELAEELDPAHSQDVKAVLCISDTCIASASRDGSVGIWQLSSQDDDQVSSTVLLALIAG